MTTTTPELIAGLVIAVLLAGTVIYTLRRKS